MNAPHRYQYGSLTRRKNISTEDVWKFRYYEATSRGAPRKVQDHRCAERVSNPDRCTSNSRTLSTSA